MFLLVSTPQLLQKPPIRRYNSTYYVSKIVLFQSLQIHYNHFFFLNNFQNKIPNTFVFLFSRPRTYQNLDRTCCHIFGFCRMVGELCGPQIPYRNHQKTWKNQGQPAQNQILCLLLYFHFENAPVLFWYASVFAFEWGNHQYFIQPIP